MSLLKFIRIDKIVMCHTHFQIFLLLFAMRKIIYKIFYTRCHFKSCLTRNKTSKNIVFLALTVLTTSLKIAALSGLQAVISRLLMCRNSPSCSMYSFSSSRLRFSLLHLFICDCGCKVYFYN